jgi:hypothetical protein
MTYEFGEPRIIRLDITPTWYGERAAREQLLPLAVGRIMQSELAGARREIRLHMDGIELEVLNLSRRGQEPFDTIVAGERLRDQLSNLRA